MLHKMKPSSGWYVASQVSAFQFLPGIRAFKLEVWSP
jgi:hypothetical protein